MAIAGPPVSDSSGSFPKIGSGAAPLHHRAWSIIAAVSWITLLLVPQRAYLNSPTFFGPRTASVVLVVLIGAAFGLLYARLWSSAATRWTSLPPHLAYAVLTACHLPLLALWLPPFAASEGGDRARLLLMICFACALGLAVLAVLSRHGRPDAVRVVVAFATATMISFALSLALQGLAHGTAVAVPQIMVWGLFLLVSMTGWGTLTNAVLAPAERFDWGQRAALGLSVLVLIGGVANLGWYISPPMVLALLAMGAGVVAGDIARPPRAARPAKVSPAVVAVIAVAVVGGLLQIAASASGTINTVYRQPAFDQHDDEQAYLVFPEKMLATGSMGPEPFEARRMLSMGGQSFLQALVLSGLPLRAVHVVDMGVAPLILLGLALGFGQRHRLDPRLTLVAVVLILVLPHPAMRGNTSALLTGVVLLVSWFRLEADEVLPAVGFPAAAVLTALTASALCALKSTFVPAAVTFLLVVATGVVGRSRHRLRAAWWMLATGGLVLLFDLPWMVSILESSGTLLYPVFGRGFYGGVYTGDFAAITGDFVLPTAAVLNSLGKQLLGLLPIVVLVPFVRGASLRRAAIALASAAAVSAILFVVLGDPEFNRSLARYAFPMASAALLGLVLGAMRPTPGGGRSRANAMAAITAAACFLFINSRAVVSSFQQQAVNLRRVVSTDPVVPEGARVAMAALEGSVPAGSHLLATLERPFLLDFKKRKIFIMSLPGMASPPPGMPIARGGEAVADYLVAHSVRYLAYGGVDDARPLLSLTEEQIRQRYPHSKTRWVMLRYHQRYHRVVEELASSRRRLFEDGRNLVLDLEVKETTFRPREHPQDVAGLVDGVWTGPQATFRNLTWPPPADIVVLRTLRWRPDAEDPEKLAVEVFADGRRLPMIAASGGVFVFRLGDRTQAKLDLFVSCAPFEPPAFGAAGPDRALGVAVDSVVLAREEVGFPSVRTIAQQASGDLVPGEVWRRSGFYRDRAWTDGDGVLDGLRWPVPEGVRTLVLSLEPMRPKRSNVVLPRLRLLVNGLELRRERASDDEVVFRLFQGLREINQIRIVSPTVSARDLGRSHDRRQLGVPVRRLSLGDE